MRPFSEYNPWVILCYFFSTAFIVMLCPHPLLTFGLLLGGICFYHSEQRENKKALHLWSILIFLLIALSNPLIVHNGKTVLFVLNHNPITLESLLYGINSATLVTGMFYWFAVFSHIMTSEKILYLTGTLSPKFALVLSMSLRFIPLFARQYRETEMAQRGMGLYSEDSILEQIRGKLRVFSIVITWALENGITTADSMEARGFGIGNRSFFRSFSFHLQDGIWILMNLILFLICGFTAWKGGFSFQFYPNTDSLFQNTIQGIGILSYLAMMLMPILNHKVVKWRWNSLQSKI